jgi:lipopolysaccharide/colanic/teichoic acid biosynthesis glycosyltransferase
MPRRGEAMPREHHPLTREPVGWAKSLMDRVGAAAGLVAALPLLVVTALAVLLVLGRPVFLRQWRAGRGGVPFQILKFRTMREGEGSDAERLGTFGRALRSTSLDELPQLWNVLRGDMSLVGPRPLLPQYLDRYTPAQARRHEVKPGLTGLSQVSGRNALSWSERLDLDVWYVDHWSLVLDLTILACSVPAVLQGRGVSAPGSATMPEFVGNLELGRREREKLA